MTTPSRVTHNGEDVRVITQQRFNIGKHLWTWTPEGTVVLPTNEGDLFLDLRRNSENTLFGVIQESIDRGFEVPADES